MQFVENRKYFIGMGTKRLGFQGYGILKREIQISCDNLC